MNTENIAIIETFIKGVEIQSTDIMPLADDVSLIGPLTSGQTYVGKLALVAFFKDIFPKFKIVSTKIEQHFTKDNIVCTLWEANFVPTATLKICDYFEIRNKQITVIRPYFDPRPLLNILSG